MKNLTRRRYANLHKLYKGNLKLMSKEIGFTLDALGILGELWDIRKTTKYQNKIIKLNEQRVSATKIDMVFNVPKGTSSKILKRAGHTLCYGHVKKSMRTYKWLFEQYNIKKRPVKEIALEMGCSTITAYNHMRAVGIKLYTSDKGKMPGRRRGPAHLMRVSDKMRTKKWLEENYIKSDKSIKEITTLMGCTPMTLYKILRRAGLKPARHY